MALYDPTSLPPDDPRRLYGAAPAVPGVPAPASPIGLDTRPLNPQGGGVDPTDPSAPLPDNEIERRLGAAGLLPEQNPAPGAGPALTPPAAALPPDPYPGAPKSWDTPTTPKAPSYPAPAPFDPSATNTAPASTLADPSAGMGQPPALPKVPSYMQPAALDPTGGSGFGGLPQQPAAPKPTQIAGLEYFDGTPESLQSPQHIARINQVLAAGSTDPGSTSTGASVPLGQGRSAAAVPGGQGNQPQTPQPYTIGGDGTVKFDASQPMTALTSAYKAGAVSDDDFKTLLPQAQAAEAAQAEQKRIQASNPAAWKSFASGAASGTAFLAGAAPGSGIGTEIGAGLGALTGPFAEVGVPVGGAIGNVVGGYIGGKLASSAFDAAVAKAAQNNATIQSFQDASALHPYWNAAGGVVSAAAGLPKAGMQAIGGLLGADGAQAGTVASKLTDALAAARATEGAAPVIDRAATLKSVFSPSNLRQAAAQGFNSGGGGLASTVSNLTQEAAIRAAQGASAGDIAKIIGYRVGGSTLGMLALDTALKEGSKALGLSPDGQTVPGAIQSALIGAFMSGHPLQFGETPPAEMANIMSRVYARQQAGVPMDAPLAPHQMPSGVDSAQATALAAPLTPRELVLSSSFEDQVRGMIARGEIAKPQTASDAANTAVSLAQGATGREVFQNGQRQATAVTIKQPAGAASASQLAPDVMPSASTSLPPSTFPTPASPDQDQTAVPTVAPASSSPPLRPSAPPAPLVGLGLDVPRGLQTSDQTSPSSTGAPAAGQVSPAPTSQDDDKQRQAAPPSASTSSDALSALTQARDGARALLAQDYDPARGTGVAPEARATTQALVDHLSRQISAAQGQSPAAPAIPDAAVPASPAPSSDDGQPTGDAADASGNAAAPRGQPADTPLPAKADSSPSAEGSTASSGPPAPAPELPTETHGDLADLINGGVATDNPDGRPSTTYQVLQRLKAGGAPITPEVARDVSNQVATIRGNADLDMPAKQEALRSIVRNGLPSEPHQDTSSDISSSSSAPAAQSASDLRGTASETSTASANGGAPEPDEPQPIAAPRQMEDRVVPTPAGPKLIPADTDDVAAARTWLANQRDAGRNPASAEVARQTGVDFQTASRLRADQSAAETRAAIPETPEVPHVKLGDKILADPKHEPWTVSKLFDDGQVGITSPGGQSKFKMKGEHALAKKVQPAPAGDGAATPATTYRRVVGDKLDSRRTAFAPESGTLGIPRPQMPQVAAEHRGAMARFLQARGMDVSAQDEAPSSLKPSQAEFNPGKVAKAGAIREAGDATPRRILTSSDGHVIDGHHQWLDRLRNAPNEPMPTLRINAPARDILSQIHEFPSAGMEKAPDIASAPGGESSQGTEQSPVPARPAERQPTTGNGKVAQDVIRKLTARKAAGEVLTPSQQESLANARALLDRELNRQVLGKSPQPVTETGKAAQRAIQSYEAARAAGAKFDPSQHAAWSNHLKVLERDFTQQRQAIEAKQAQAPAPSEAATSQKPALSRNEPALSRNEPALSRNEPSAPAASSPAPASASSTPAASTPAPAFKPRQEVVYKGRPAVIESIEGDRAVVRVRAGQDPTSGANLVARKVTGVPVSALRAKPAAPATEVAPVTRTKAIATANEQYLANRGLLRDMGVTSRQLTKLPAGSSGIAFGEDGVLRIDPDQLATSMTTVGKNQQTHGIGNTPEDWFLHVLDEEGTHGVGNVLAKEANQTPEQFYESVPDEAYPADWQEAGRAAYGKAWDQQTLPDGTQIPMPKWKQKAEFTRMIFQGKYLGRITEALYKFLGKFSDYFNRLAKLEGIDPRLKSFLEKYGERLEQVRQGSGKAPRSFKMPTAAGGYHDVLDHIAAEGGMVSQARARGRDTFTKYAGDYDGAPTLGGFYHHAVYRPESSTMPDQMAETLHQEYGVGDGSVDGMWKAIQQAVDSRRAASARQKTLGDAQKQTDRFDRDAVEQATAKGAHAINVAELNVGDHVTIGDQTLKVIGVDPDNLDVTLEDHTKYGVQRVADGTALYVEKVQPAGGDNSLAAARPDRQTMDLFPEDEPFDLRGEALPDAERVAAARELARQQPPAAPEQPASPSAAVPRISAGERGTGDLFQGDDAPFNLQGEEGTDGERVQRALEQSARDAAEAKAIQARDQGSLFAAAPEEENASEAGRPQTPDPSHLPSIRDVVDDALTPNTGERRRYTKFGTVTPEQATQLKTDTGLDLGGYRRNLDNMAVRHIWREHGDPASEIARGNAPLNRADFEKLPQVLANPDASIHAGKNDRGQDVILSAKRVNGYYIVAEEVRRQPGVLNVASLYKKSAPPLASGAGEPTPLQFQSTARTILEQAARNYKLKGRSGGDSLAAAAPEAVEEAGAKRPDDPKSLKAARDTWKAVGTRSPMFKNWFGDWQKDPAAASKVVDAKGKPLVVYHGSPALANGGGFDAFHVPASAGDLLAGSGVYLTDSKPIAQSYTLNRDELLSGGNVDARNVPDSTPVLPLYANIRKPFQAGDAGLVDARAIVAAELAKQPPEPPLRRRDGTVVQPPSATERAAQAVENAAQLYPPGDPLRSYHVLRDALSNEGVIQNARISGGDQLRDVLQAHGFDGITHEGGVQGGQKHSVFVAFDPTQVKSAEPAGSARSNSGVFDPNNPSMLAAAAPEAEDPLFEKPVAPASSTLKKGSQAWAKAKLAEQRAKSEMVDAISAHKDAAGTMADIAGRQANESVQLNIPDDRDRQAAGPVVEAGGDRARLAADLAKVQASPNRKLAAKYAPIYQHALDNLPRLNAAADGYRQVDVREDAAAERAGLPPQWQARMKHLYDDPTSPESTIVPDKGFGATTGFKTAADAIAAGVDPKSTDLGDLAQRRVQRNQSAINTHAFQKGLADLKASDGKLIIGDNIEASSKLDPDGKVATSQKLPAGYEAVQAGPNVLTVHKEFAPLLRALYGESAVANNFLGKHLLDLAAVTKHGAIGIDTYHSFQVVIRSLLGHGVADYKEGLAGLRFADADLDRAVKAGKISQEDADATRAARHVDEGLLREGLNVGKAGDNLLEAARQHNLVAHIPVLGKAATWVNEKTFHEIQPGFMRQAARAVFARNQARFPELSEQELFRRTAREVNEFYGNLGSQGFLKSKTMQDLARLTLFAPGFTEGRFRTEARGVGQAARVPVDGFSGRGWRLGTVAQAMGGIVLASLIGNQVVNLLTRGKPTWENEEDGHKLDAWLPGGPHGKGFFFSPLSIAAEYSHSLIKYMEHRESAVDALAHIAGNKLSGGARAVQTLVTGKDYKGQPFASMGERLKAAALEVLPLPMQLSPWVDKDPKGLLGLKFNHEKGSLEKQLLASAGLRVDPADSARSQMYNLAQPFRGPQADQQPHGPSAYAALRTALGNEDADGARAEIQRLVTEGHKTLGQIADKAAGIKDGKVHPELFTGSREKDLQMLASLTPAQKQVYRQAFQDRVADARLFAHLIATMPADQKRALQMASAMNGRGNKTGATQVAKSSVLQPDTPAPSVPAQPAAPALRPQNANNLR